MRHRSLILSAAVGLIAVGFFATGPAQAAYRVIQWRASHICQIYNFGWGGRPIPPDYRVLTRPLPSFGAALRAKDRLWRAGRGSVLRAGTAQVGRQTKSPKG